MTLNEALDILGEDQTFRATLYAMNTLLINKGVYSAQEFEKNLIEYAINFQRGFRGKSQVSRQSSHATTVANP